MAERGQTTKTTQIPTFTGVPNTDKRKILHRCYHTLRELGDAALALPDTPAQEVAA